MSGISFNSCSQFSCVKGRWKAWTKIDVSYTFMQLAWSRIDLDIRVYGVVAARGAASPFLARQTPPPPIYAVRGGEPLVKGCRLRGEAWMP
ncbi:hypothetical protein HanIR_Chr06g0272421 [Helianthus annuus]|nr:hypothetical protein HanIR_Chr06g0272421 [Helianthus annuus]